MPWDERQFIPRTELARLGCGKARWSAVQAIRAVWRGACLSAAALALLGLGGPAAAAASDGVSGAALVGLRWGYGPPSGVALQWASGPGSWWLAGLDFNPELSGPESVWVRRHWSLRPDTLARVGLQAGYTFDPTPWTGLTRGAWVGVYVGQQWRAGVLVAELGTGLRIPTGSPELLRWDTGAAFGLAW